MKRLKKGDTIKCHDKDELLELHDALQKDGYDTDFVYERDGLKGLWIVIEMDRNQ